MKIFKKLDKMMKSSRIHRIINKCFIKDEERRANRANKKSAS